MVGTSRPQRSQSSSVRSTPTRPAMARRWITALVDPPMAALVRMAFSNASFTSTSDGFRSSLTICTIRRPDSCAITRRRHVHGRDRRVARQRHAQRLGHATPWWRRCPSCCTTPPSGSSRPRPRRTRPWSWCPAFTASEKRQRCGARADPLALVVAVQHRPAGDDDAREVGRGGAPSAATAWSCRSPRAARSRPSAGRASPPRPPSRRGCGTSSRSGGSALSEVEKTGTSTGKPPASKMPCFTFSARMLRWALQGVSSDQVLRMPITGRPSNRSFGRP